MEPKITEGLSKPPEGALVGETVHPDSEQDEYDDSLIRRVEGKLKSKSDAFANMNDSELRERALEYIDKYLDGKEV